MVVVHPAPSAISVMLQISRIAPQGRSNCTAALGVVTAAQRPQVCQILCRRLSTPVWMTSRKVESEALHGQGFSCRCLSIAAPGLLSPGRDRTRQNALPRFWCAQVMRGRRDHSRPSKSVHRGYTAIDESMSHGNVVTSTHVLLRDLVCVSVLSIK